MLMAPKSDWLMLSLGMDYENHLKLILKSDYCIKNLIGSIFFDYTAPRTD